MPTSSRRRAIFTLSSTESDRPSRWVPSRRVVSYRSRFMAASRGAVTGHQNERGLSSRREAAPRIIGSENPSAECQHAASREEPDGEAANGQADATDAHTWDTNAGTGGVNPTRTGG